MTWTELNTALRNMRTEAEVHKLYDEQRLAGCSQRFAHRIWSRLTVLRKKRERAEIDAAYKGPRRKKGVLNARIR
jgi:hypothetical protein